MILPLSYFGSPVLRETAEPVTRFDAELKQLAADMVETMRDESGIGLAGPQVGQPLRIFVMEIPEDMDVDEGGKRLNPTLETPLVVVNPNLTLDEEFEEEMEEGCLSIPEVRGNVTRPYALTLEFQDVEGHPHSLTLCGLAARCVQHENDHLNGILFIDYLGSVKKMAIKGKLKRIKERQSRG
jgi:peptide deformylase